MGRTANSSKRDKRLEEGRKSFSSALERLRSEEGFRAWLEAQRSLHQYSIGNTLWLLFQNPRATRVASYKTWRDQLGYQVRRGENGLMVWVPAPFKVVEEDPESGEEIEIRRMRFRVGKVFDRSQVDPIPGEAKPLAPPPTEPVEGDSHAWAIPLLEAFTRETLGFEIKRLSLPQGQDGFCDSTSRVIGLRDRLPPNAEVRVLVHEDAHAEGIRSSVFGRGRAEAIVDCAAYMVCARIGLDVSASSVPYVAAWAKDDIDVIERDAKAIDAVASAILNGAGLENRRAKQVDAPPAPHETALAA